MKKYIVKNCPALNLPLFEDYEEPAIKNGCMQEETGCEEINNCLIKQIVDLCKYFKNNFVVNQAVQMLTDNILNKLQIEEIE